MKEDTIAQVLVAMGGMYGVGVLADRTLDGVRKFFTQSLEKGGSTTDLLAKAEDAQSLLLLNLIFQIAPCLNDACKLDCLTREAGDSQYYGGSSAFKSVMGLCYNNEVYYQMSKGLLNADILEILSN